MSKKYGELAQQLRQVFNASPDEYLTSQTLYERMGAAGPTQQQERESIRDTLPWLLRCGFLVKQGRGMTASFKASGQGMKRQRLTEEFGVELIRAGAYGSNDAGPLGYQCPHCVGNVYHVLSQTQYLEIVDQEEDRPVAPGEAGRLIFTSLARRGQKVARYEIGDMGRWVTEPCPCSRQSPRFELLGRTGDLFRAPNFFNYQTFCRVLTDHAGYAGAVQLQLSHAGRNDQIRVLLEAESGLAPASVRQLLLDHYPDLRQFVNEVKFTDLEVTLISLSEFATTPSTGKLKHIVDLRSPA